MIARCFFLGRPSQDWKHRTHRSRDDLTLAADDRSAALRVPSNATACGSRFGGPLPRQEQAQPLTEVANIEDSAQARIEWPEEGETAACSKILFGG